MRAADTSQGYVPPISVSSRNFSEVGSMPAMRPLHVPPDITLMESVQEGLTPMRQENSKI